MAMKKAETESAEEQLDRFLDAFTPEIAAFARNGVGEDAQAAAVCDRDGLRQLQRTGVWIWTDGEDVGGDFFHRGIIRRM